MSLTFHPDRLALSRAGFTVALAFAQDLDWEGELPRPLPAEGAVTLDAEEVARWREVLSEYARYLQMFPADAQYAAENWAVNDAQSLLAFASTNARASAAERDKPWFDLAVAYPPISIDEAVEAWEEMDEERPGIDLFTNVPHRIQRRALAAKPIS